VTAAWGLIVGLAAFAWEASIVLSPNIAGDMTVSAGGFTQSSLLTALGAAVPGIVVGMVAAVALYFVYGRRRGPVYFAALGGPVLFLAANLGLELFDYLTSPVGERSIAANPINATGWAIIMLAPSLAACVAVAFISAGDGPRRGGSPTGESA
jgi:hypothetical protein